jgi:hypothetical protein
VRSARTRTSAANRRQGQPDVSLLSDPALQSGSLRILYLGVGSPSEPIMFDSSHSLHSHRVEEGGDRYGFRWQRRILSEAAFRTRTCDYRADWRRPNEQRDCSPTWDRARNNKNLPQAHLRKAGYPLARRGCGFGARTCALPFNNCIFGAAKLGYDCWRRRVALVASADICFQSEPRAPSKFQG